MANGTTGGRAIGQISKALGLADLVGRNALFRELGLIDEFGRPIPTNRPTDFPRGFSLEELGFEGQLVPGPGPLLQMAAERAAGIGTSDLSLQRLSALERGLSGRPSIELDPAVRERFFQESIVQPRLQQLQREILPGIAARFLPRGQTGAQQAATSTALRDVTRDLAALQASFLRDDERLRAQLAEGAAARAGAFLPLAQQEEFGGIELGARLGGIMRAIQAQQNQEQLLRGLLQQPFFDPRLPLFGALSGNPLLAQQPSIASSLFGLGVG